jgi:hypothetical protein
MCVCVCVCARVCVCVWGWLAQRLSRTTSCALGGGARRASLRVERVSLRVEESEVSEPGELRRASLRVEESEVSEPGELRRASLRVEESEESEPGKPRRASLRVERASLLLLGRGVSARLVGGGGGGCHVLGGGVRLVLGCVKGRGGGRGTGVYTCSLRPHTLVA